VIYKFDTILKVMRTIPAGLV